MPTGRRSEPAMQSIPIRTELGRKIRDAFTKARADMRTDVPLDTAELEWRFMLHFLNRNGKR